MNTVRLRGAENAAKAFEILHFACSKSMRYCVKLISIQEYLYASLQSMVRMGKTNGEMQTLITQYDSWNTTWKIDYKRLHLNRYVNFSLWLIEHRLVSLFRILTKMKDFAKKKYMNR